MTGFPTAVPPGTVGALDSTDVTEEIAMAAAYDRDLIGYGREPA